ncbi:MAG: hypothetical protein IJ099_00205 [Alphaproteobacteria bacterium]|nr:hypothetical protein [Alphaproteobacteria bacterium]
MESIITKRLIGNKMEYDITTEIKDIFEESIEGYPRLTIDERGKFESNTATISSTIGTLGELFCEYYLSAPSEIGSLEEFLQKENIDKFITKDNYEKLICGKAYLPSESLEYFRLKMPFPISQNKMHSLNAKVRLQNRYAEMLNLDMNELLKETSIMRKSIIEEREKRYHEYDVRFAKEHREEIAQKAREKYHSDEEYRQKVRAASKERYDGLSPEAKEKMNAQQRKKYATDDTYRKKKNEKNRKRYALLKERMAQDPEYAALVRKQRRKAKQAQRAKQKKNIGNEVNIIKGPNGRDDR